VLLYLGCTTNQSSIPFGYLLYLLVWSHQGGSVAVFSGVFIAEEVVGVGENGSGDITTVDVQTLFETFLKMSPDVYVS
jgi:hypothetical protein